MDYTSRSVLGMSRPSPLLHTLAVLRSVTGLAQKELATLVECHPRTIQAVELGQNALTHELAQKVTDATGVALDWLVADDISKPVRARIGGIYSRETFVAWQKKIGKADRGILASKLAEDNDKLLQVVKAVAHTGLTLKKKLRESAETRDRLTGLLSEVVERGQAWRDLAKAYQRRFLLASEALQALEGKPKIGFKHLRTIRSILQGRNNS